MLITCPPCSLQAGPKSQPHHHHHHHHFAKGRQRERCALLLLLLLSLPTWLHPRPPPPARQCLGATSRRHPTQPQQTPLGPAPSLVPFAATLPGRASPAQSPSSSSSSCPPASLEHSVPAPRAGVLFPKRKCVCVLKSKYKSSLTQWLAP